MTVLGAAKPAAGAALDHGQRVALGEHLPHQDEPSDVLAAVVAGAAADLGRREQATRLVGAYVAGREPRLLGQLVDRHELAVYLWHGADSTYKDDATSFCVT